MGITHGALRPTFTVLLLVAAAIAGCDTPEPSPPPPPVVEVATPTTRSVTEYFRYTGTLEAVASVGVRARVAGYLEEIRFTESTDVEKGAVLFVIEKEPYEIAVSQAEAEIARARAAQRIAETRLARSREALELNAATEFEVLEDNAALQQAEADVLAAEQLLAAARLDLSYTDVVAPMKGRIDRHYVDAGNLVGRGEATELARIVSLDPVHVWFDVSERISLLYLSGGYDGSVNPESPLVEVGLADEEGYPHPGQVDFVDNTFDAGTATLRVRAALPNPTGKLYPGLFARIRVPWRTRDAATVVQEEAVSTGLEGKFLLVVNDENVVSRRPVTLGERQDDGTIVVLEGLEPDERYIVRGVQKARPGATVDPKPFTSEHSASEKAGA